MKVSGRVIYDKNRSGNLDGGDVGIEGAKVVLQDKQNLKGITVITGSNGNYEFNNVPQGNYRLVEDNSQTDGTASPVDFTNATTKGIPSGNDPNIRIVQGAPAEATRMDSLTVNYIDLVVSSSDLANNDFLNGVIREERINIGDAIAVDPNLLNGGDKGTFGSNPPGFPKNTSPSNTLYPGLVSGFQYQQYTADKPNDGEYSISNIALQSYGWWKIANHTTFDERGNFLIVNGSNPGATLYKDTVTSKPNTEYLFSSWVINMSAGIINLALPRLAIKISGNNGQVFFQRTLNDIKETSIPTWVESGAVFNSGTATRVTVEFLSDGPSAGGNDYAIDDISLREVRPSTPVVENKKSVDKSEIVEGGMVTYTSVFKTDLGITNLIYRDTVPVGTTFIGGSVTVNGVVQGSANPENGINLGNFGDNSVVTVTFKVINTRNKMIKTLLNTSEYSYSYKSGSGKAISNTVTTKVKFKELLIKKDNDKKYADIGDEILYTIILDNIGDIDISNLIFKDTIPIQTNFLIGSSKLNGNAIMEDPEKTGILINSIKVGEKATITFKVKVKSFI